MRAPGTDGVEILEREPHRFKDPVARRAGRTSAMRLQDLAHGWRLRVSSRVRWRYLECRVHVRRWLGRADPEERLQKPLAPDYRRRRAACEVTVSNAPLPRRPRRMSNSGPSVTRRNCGP